MNLFLLLLVPLASALAVLLCKTPGQVRALSLGGALVQFGLAIYLLFQYWIQRSSGNLSSMIFEYDYSWFEAWNIHFHIGVDGISVAMILLTAFVVLAGILVSWTPVKWNKEFFFLLLFLPRLCLLFRLIPLLYF